MKNRKIKILALAIIVLSLPIIQMECQDKRHWQFEYLPGLSYVPPLPVSFHQEGHSTIKMTAKYITRSLEMPIYYSYRFSTWKGRIGWSIEMNHLKIYLDNETDEVQDFSVSHGYNQIFINRHLIKEKYSWILGGGIVLGHPESIVRGQKWDEKGGLWNRGYYLAGASIQGAFYFPLINTKYVIVPLEAKLTLGYGHVPIVEGHARVPVISISILSGLGLRL